MSVWKRVKAAFGRYLEHLGRENQALFGGSRPDCCTLNRKRPPDTPAKKG